MKIRTFGELAAYAASHDPDHAFSHFQVNDGNVTYGNRALQQVQPCLRQGTHLGKARTVQQNIDGTCDVICAACGTALLKNISMEDALKAQAFGGITEETPWLD